MHCHLYHYTHIQFFRDDASLWYIKRATKDCMYSDKKHSNAHYDVQASFLYISYWATSSHIAECTETKETAFLFLDHLFDIHTSYWVLPSPSITVHTAKFPKLYIYTHIEPSSQIAECTVMNKIFYLISKSSPSHLYIDWALLSPSSLYKKSFFPHSIYSQLQIGWHSISRLFLKLFQRTRILPKGFMISTKQ